MIVCFVGEGIVGWGELCGGIWKLVDDAIGVMCRQM